VWNLAQSGFWLDVLDTSQSFRRSSRLLFTVKLTDYGVRSNRKTDASIAESDMLIHKSDKAADTKREGKMGQRGRMACNKR